MDDLGIHHRSLNIIHAHNTQLYTTHLKHNNYLSIMSSCLKEKYTDEEHTQADFSLKKTDLHISLPYPISVPFDWDVQPDPCLEIVKEKAEFKKKLECYRNFYKKDKKHLTFGKITKSCTKKELVNLPHYLVDLVVHGDKNPHFDGSYDWFYTQGNLEVVEVHNNPILVSAQGQNIVFTNLKNSNQQQITINATTPIYNIRGYQVENKTYLTLRMKDKIEMMQLDFKSTRSLDFAPSLVYTTDDIELNEDNPPPYIDTLIFDETKLICADVAYEVSIHDIETKTVSHKRKFELDPHQKGDLCQLESISNCLMFMGRDKLSMLDFRISSKEKEKSIALREGYFQCNDLCAMSLSCLNDNFLYVASKHNIYKIDIREMKVVKKWTHLLDNSPIIIKTMLGSCDGEEYVFVASFNETVCVHVSSCNHLPFKVLNLNDTFTKVQLEKEFIVREDLEKRLNLSTAGLAAYDSCIFTSNSIGDVCKYYVGGDKHHDKNACFKLKAYIDELDYNPKQMRVTHFKDLSTLRNICLKKKVDRTALSEYQEPNFNLKKFLTPAMKFGKYDIATIWDSERIAPLDDTGTEEQHKERIDTWLAQTTNEYDPIDQEMDYQ